MESCPCPGYDQGESLTPVPNPRLAVWNNAVGHGQKSSMKLTFWKKAATIPVVRVVEQGVTPEPHPSTPTHEVCPYDLIGGVENIQF